MLYILVLAATPREGSGRKGKGKVNFLLVILVVKIEIMGSGGTFSRGDLSWEGDGNLPKTLPRSMTSFTVKENHIESAVNEIFRYTQTHILLL